MHGPAEDHHSQEKQLQKEAPRCDEMWPDLRWVRNKGRGEDGGLSAQVTELPILERSFLLPAFSKGLAPPSKGRPHKLDPRGARRVEQSQGPQKHQDTSCGVTIILRAEQNLCFSAGCGAFSPAVTL